jgi:hypothetical protein
MAKVAPPQNRDVLQKIADALGAGLQSGTEFAGAYYTEKAKEGLQQKKDQAARLKGTDILSLQKLSDELRDLPLDQQLRYSQNVQDLLTKNPQMSKDEAFVKALQLKEDIEPSLGGRRPKEEKKRFQHMPYEKTLPGQVKAAKQANIPEEEKMFKKLPYEKTLPGQVSQMIKETKELGAKAQGMGSFRERMGRLKPEIKTDKAEQVLAGLAEDATFGFWQPSKLPENASERLKAARQIGKLAGPLLPYGAAFKGLGLGTKLIMKMSGLKGVPAFVLNKSLKLAGSGFIGSSFADLSAYGHEGREATPEERRSNALGMMAFEGAIIAHGMAKDFNQVVNFISKGTNQPKESVYRWFYDKAKDKVGSFFKGGGARQAPTPQGMAVGGPAQQAAPLGLPAPGEAAILQGMGAQPPRSRPPTFPVKEDTPIKLEDFEAGPQDVQAIQQTMQEAAQELQADPAGLAARISAQYPEQPAGRVEKVREKRPFFKEPEATEMRHRELEAFPKYEAELVQYESDRAERRGKISAAEKMHIPERQKTAEALYPKAVERYQKLSSDVRAIEDEMAKLASDKRDRARALLKYTEEALANAEQDVIEFQRMMETGKAGEMIEDLEKRIQKKIAGITEAIEEGQEPKLTKSDYNPARIKEAEKLRKAKKPLPSRLKKKDVLFQRHEMYKDAYKKKLEKINRELAELGKPTALGDARQKANLLREKDVLEKLVEHAEADITLHEHQRNLLNLRATQRAEERFRKLKVMPSKGERKIALPSREQLGKLQREGEALVRDPTPENAERLLEKAPPEMKQEYPHGERTDIYEKPSREGERIEVKPKEGRKPHKPFKSETKEPSPPPNVKGEKFDPNDVAKAAKEAKKEGKQFWKDMFEGTYSAKATKERFQEFKNAWKESPLKAIFKTPLGHYILAHGAIIGYEEATGEKVPIELKSLAFTYFLTRPGLGPLAAVVGLIRKSIDKGKVAHYKNQYRDAVRSGNLYQIKKAKDNLSTKQIKELRREMQL